MSGWRPEFPEFIEKQREAERQKERQGQEVQRLEQQSNLQAWSNTQASYDWFARLFDKRLDQHIERDRPEVIAAFAEFVVERERKVCKAYDAKLATLETEIKTMKQQASFAQQFADLARDLDARQIARDEAKRASEMIPQGEVLAEIEKLQRQLDDLKGVANLEARVGELEKTNSLEARFTKLVNEAKGAEVPELLAKIERLQHQIDDLNKVAAQSGPQGPPGPPGKLPRVKEYDVEPVHYEADVVVHAGALWQACADTVHAPPHSDWICIARAGRDGSDGGSPNVRGTYDAREKYERLDIVAFDGGSFIPRRDDPGICPGDGWQLLSRQGRPGNRGKTGERGVRGDKGERGEPGETIVSWQLDRERYRVSPLMSDGKVGPNLELRAIFEQFLSENYD